MPGRVYGEIKKNATYFYMPQEVIFALNYFLLH